MTSRQLLWLALSIAALPPLFEATSGCSFEPQRASSPVLDNAYECSCTCDAGPGSGSIAVRASSDDAEEAPGGAMDISDTNLNIGARIVGLRFDSPGIPPGSAITSAAVQLTAAANDAGGAAFQIVGQLSPNAPTFSTANGDLSGRAPVTAAIAWNPNAWTNGAAGPDQRTPELAALVQDLVNQAGWSSGSPIVLLIQGTGQRAARSFDQNPAQAAVLQVTFQASTAATTLPICAPEGIGHDAEGRILQAEAAADCSGRVTQTFSGLANACTYPTPCSCTLVDQAQGDDSFDSSVCRTPCAENPLAPGCLNFDPDAFNECLAAGGTVATCKDFVSATNAPGGTPVCVASGSPMAFHLFGRRSHCEVSGLAEIEVGDREPKHDPETTGTVEILGGPCVGGGCSLGASFRLAMDPITFSVRFASDPTFGDLSALGHTRSETVLDPLGVALFAEDTVEGTGNGRRGASGLAVDAFNQSPLALGVDWVGRSCSLAGNLASTVDGEVPDGLCQGDGSTLCTADSPDCDDVGGPCVFEAEDIEPMLVNVDLGGTLLNQPPTSSAGADQTLECTSPAGASFTLEGRASSDPDQDIALASWRAGSRIGPEAGRGLALVQTLGVGVTQSYVLRVIDSFAQADEDDTQVAVVDTTPPELSLSVSPTSLWPPNHKFRPVTATLETSDICDASPAIRLVSITSDEPGDGQGDGSTSPDVQGAAFGTDDRAFLLRAERSGNGGGRVYTITYEAEDDSGNVTMRQATVSVAHNQ